MRAVVQRVARAEVRVADELVARIDHGLCVLLGIAATDAGADAALLCRKILALRVFADEAGRMNRSVDEVGGALLIVSEFTLHADCRHGRRPSFAGAAAPDHARPLYDHFVALASAGPVPVATGRFGASMALSLVNDGPVTLLLDTSELR